MAWEQAEVRSLKPNRYVLIGDEPCRIISITTSKPGKHGEAKARIECFGLFDNQKRSIVHPVTHKVRVPMIDRRRAQVLSLQGGEVQLMDLETYETFTLPVPADFEGKLEPSKDVQYMVAMGRPKLLDRP
ncbi:MAG: translation initiation factor IF-5A [Thermoplasmata archaeon]